MKKSYLFLTLSIAFSSVSIYSCGSNKNDIKEYELNFYVDEKVYYTVTSKGNELITLPKEPVKENYKFEGWYLDKNYQNEFKEDTFLNSSITSNLNIYSKFTSIIDVAPIKPTITFFVEDEIYFQILTNGNEKLNLPKDPIKNGFRFENWYLDDEFKVKFDISIYESKPLTNSIDVYAKFLKEEEMVPIKKVINFYVNENLYHQIFTNGNEKLILPTEPTLENKLFKGWYIDKTFLTVFDVSYYETHELIDNINIYAKFEDIEPEIKQFEIDENGKIVKFLDTTSKIVEIPKSIDGIDVLEIGSQVFKDNLVIEEIHLPSTIKSLGFECFKGAKNLNKVVINSDITTIPSSCFENCISLTNINLPDSIKYINSNSFRNTNLESFIAPKSLIDIGIEAFKDAKNLKTLDLGNVKKLYRAAFEGCANLKKVELPNSLENLDEDFVFFKCSSLESIKMPTSIKSVSKTIFNDTKAYLDPLNWTDEGFYVDNYLICLKTDFNKETFKVKEGTKSIASGAFGYFDNLKEILLPEGLEVISKTSFAYSKNIEKVNIPSTIKNIGYDAFYGTKIYSTQSNWINDVLYLDNWLLNIKSIKNENTKNLIIKENTIGISDGELFNYSGRSHFESLTLNEGLKYIGNNSFKNTKLTTLNIPSSLLYIGYNAFYGTNINEVLLPLNTKIEDNSFNKETIINRQ